MLPFFLIPCLLFSTPLVKAQNDPEQLPNSFPHAYPGIPNPNYVYNSTNKEQWQDYYRVNTSMLPNTTQCTFPSSYAGSVPVNRPNQMNDTLFMWAVEKTAGSLANESSNDPWIIWLNGGPGSSSMIGLLLEHGPCRIGNDFSLAPNNFSIVQLADVIYLDQPVGTGFSTASSNGYIEDEDQMGQDFMGYLANLVEIFPRLRKRPLYLVGESYAGTYIPYITKAYFEMETPPVMLKHIVIGDGTLAKLEAVENVPMVAVLETYPQLIDFDIEVYEYFRGQAHLCGYDLNLTFPQAAPLPSVRDEFLEDGFFADTAKALKRSRFSLQRVMRASQATSSLSKRDISTDIRKREFQEKVRALKRSSPSSSSIAKRESPGLSERGNATTIDPAYECDLFDEVIDWAVNFTEPWSSHDFNGFDVYSIPDALDPEAPASDLPGTPTGFMNDPRTVMALHAPTSMNWSDSVQYPFNNTLDVPEGANAFGDTSSPPVMFLTQLATNASQQGVGMTFLSGGDDLLVSPFSTLAGIQNFTFGGIRGFTQVPSVAWYDDNGEFAGIVHQERNVTFGLFAHAGHLLAVWNPDGYQSFLREFVFKHNINGTLDCSGNPIGDPSPEPLLPHALDFPGEHNPIFTGSGTTMGSTIWPSATIASWDSVIARLISTSTPTAHVSPELKPKNGFTPMISTIPINTLICLLVVVSGLMIIY